MKRFVAVLTGALLLWGNGYSEEYQQEVVKLSTGEKIVYTGLGLGGLAGVVLIADNMSSDSDGTKVEIGDPPPEEEPTPLMASLASPYREKTLRDIGRINLYLEDLSGIFREMGRMRRSGEGTEVSFFVEALDRRGEYEGAIGGVYFMKNVGEYFGADIRGSLGYGHSSVDYDGGAEGSSEVIHWALHLNYDRDVFKNYTWLSNEFSYNRFQEGEKARYRGTSLALGTENGYLLTAGRFQVIPFIFAQGSFYKREAIDLEDVRAGSDNYTSFKWGPGIEGKYNTQAGTYDLSTSMRVVYRMEEGNIYDEVSTSQGGIEGAGEDEVLELSLEGRGERDNISVFARAAYYIQGGDNYYGGSLGVTLGL